MQRRVLNTERKTAVWNFLEVWNAPADNRVQGEDS